MKAFKENYQIKNIEVENKSDLNVLFTRKFIFFSGFTHVSHACIISWVITCKREYVARVRKTRPSFIRSGVGFGTAPAQVIGGRDRCACSESLKASRFN